MSSLQWEEGGGATLYRGKRGGTVMQRGEIRRENMGKGESALV